MLVLVLVLILMRILRMRVLVLTLTPKAWRTRALISTFSGLTETLQMVLAPNHRCYLNPLVPIFPQLDAHSPQLVRALVVIAHTLSVTVLDTTRFVAPRVKLASSHQFTD